MIITQCLLPISSILWFVCGTSKNTGRTFGGYFLRRCTPHGSLRRLSGMRRWSLGRMCSIQIPCPVDYHLVNSYIYMDMENYQFVDSSMRILQAVPHPFADDFPMKQYETHMVIFNIHVCLPDGLERPCGTWVQECFRCSSRSKRWPSNGDLQWQKPVNSVLNIWSKGKSMPFHNHKNWTWTYKYIFSIILNPSSGGVLIQMFFVETPRLNLGRRRSRTCPGWRQTVATRPSPGRAIPSPISARPYQGGRLEDQRPTTKTPPCCLGLII